MTMDTSIDPTAAFDGRIPERRTRPRLACSYPVRLRRRHAGGRIETRGVAANLSSSGVYVFTRRIFEIGEPMFLLLRMTGQVKTETTSPQIAAFGEVVRVEPQPDTTCGVAIRLKRVRFL